MQSVGRALQILGLVLLPLGLFYGIERPEDGTALEFGFLAAGAAAFLIGMRLQKSDGA